MICDRDRLASRRGMIILFTIFSVAFLLSFWTLGKQGPARHNSLDHQDLYLGKWHTLPEVSLLRQDAISRKSQCNPFIPVLHNQPPPVPQPCTTDGGMLLFIGVMSTPQARWRRDIYRSMMPVDGSEIRRMFVLGEVDDPNVMAQLRLESELYGDILLLSGVRERCRRPRHLLTYGTDEGKRRWG